MTAKPGRPWEHHLDRSCPSTDDDDETFNRNIQHIRYLFRLQLLVAHFSLGE